MKNDNILNGRLPVFVVTLVGTWILALLLVHFIATQNMRISDHTDTQVATALWGLGFFLLLFPRFIKEVDANTVQIWANPFVSEEIPKPGSFTGMEELHGQRALRAGWNLTYPWEYQVEGGDIETNKKIIVEIPTQSFKTKDGKQLEVSGCRLILTVLPPYEVSHFRYIMGHGGSDIENGYEQLKQYFRTEVVTFIQQYMIKLDADVLQANSDDFKRAFKEQFGGLGPIDPREERTGTWTGEPSFGRVAKHPGMDPNEAWRMSLAFAKKIDVNFDISETTAKIKFEDGDKLPEGFHMNLGGMVKGFGGKGGGGGNKNRPQKPGAPLPAKP